MDVEAGQDASRLKRAEKLGFLAFMGAKCEKRDRFGDRVEDFSYLCPRNDVRTTRKENINLWTKN